MVAHLIGLKLRLTVNGWRRSTLQLVLTVIGLVYVGGLLVLAGVAAWALSTQSVELRGTVLVVAMAVGVLLWLVVPLFFTGVDLTLDPAAFATFGIAPRRLVTGLLLAGMIGLPGLGTTLALVLSAVTWRGHSGAVLAAIPAALLGALFCVALSYAVTGLLGSVAGRRRVRETLSLVAMVPLVLAGVIIGTVADSVVQVVDRLPGIASVLVWTPLGSFTGVPWAVADGRPLQALALFALCLVWLAAVLALWELAIRRSVERVGAGSGTRTPSTAGLGLIGRVPATPAGAVAARSLIYWLRDPRYSASLVILPALLVLFWFLGQQGESAALLLAMGPLAGFMLGYAISADIAYDGTAFALHVTAGVSGRDDRVGRTGALLAWSLPLTVLLTVVTAWVAGQWAVLPGLLGLSVGILLSSAGVSSLVSARFIYPVPPPGASPFATPKGSTVRIMVVQLASMVVAAILVIPEIVLFVVALVTGQALFHWLTLAAGLVLGTVLLVVGIRLGARWYDRAQAETYQAVLTFS